MKTTDHWSALYGKPETDDEIIEIFKDLREICDDKWADHNELTKFEEFAFTYAHKIVAAYKNLKKECEKKEEA